MIVGILYWFRYFVNKIHTSWLNENCPDTRHVIISESERTHIVGMGMIYSSHNGFRIKSELKRSEYNCNHDLVLCKAKNQIGFSIIV